MALGAGIAGLTACSGPPEGAGVPLDYWHLMSGGDGILMGDMVAAINERQETFSATQTVLAWGSPYYTKLAMASVGGRAPDLAVMHASRVAGYAPGGLLDPWDLDELARVGITPDRFTDRVWEKSQFDGEVFAIAMDTHPYIMMVNTDHADAAGVLESDGTVEISSPEQLVEVGTRLAEVTGGTGLSYGYLGDGASMWRFFYTLYRQQGATMTLTSGQEAEYDMDAAVTALETIRSILDGKIAVQANDLGGSIAEFVSGSSGILFTGVWETPTVETAGIPYAATPIPTMFSEEAAYADSHSFVLPRQAETDPAARRAAYDFVGAMLADSATWAQAGHVPAFLPVVESETYQQLPASSYAQVADIVNYDPEAYFSGSGSNFQNYFAENIQNVLLGRVDARSGMQGFIDRVNQLLLRPNPVQ